VIPINYGPFLFVPVKGSSLFLTHKAIPFDKMGTGMLDPEMIDGSAKIVNEAIKDKVRVNLINNRAGSNPL